MSTASEPPQIQFVVEVGAQNQPMMKVKVKDKVVPMSLSSAQAGELGRALLAVSAVSSSSMMHPEGTRIQNCHFPVVKWATGQSHTNGLPILVLETVGGTQLAFQFEKHTAEECGEALTAATRRA